MIASVIAIISASSLLGGSIIGLHDGRGSLNCVVEWLIRFKFRPPYGMVGDDLFRLAKRDRKHCAHDLDRAK